MNFVFRIWYTHSGAQLAVFEGRDPVHKKEHIRTFSRKIRPVNIVFQLHNWRKHCGRFTDIVAMKTNDSYCYLLSGKGGKYLESRLFLLREMPFLI